MKQKFQKQLCFMPERKWRLAQQAAGPGIYLEHAVLHIYEETI